MTTATVCRAQPSQPRDTGSVMCSEEGCAGSVLARGLCGRCYGRRRRNRTLPTEWPQTRADRRPSEPCPTCGCLIAASGRDDHLRTHRVCPWCGPWTATQAQCSEECPTCRMTPGEHAYRARILADSDAVLRQEYAEWRANRERG